MARTLAEQMADLKATRDAAVATMDTVMQKSVDEKRSMNSAYRVTTRDTCVCWSISSETRMRYASRVRRQGRSRAERRYQARSRRPKSLSARASSAGSAPRRASAERGTA